MKEVGKDMIDGRHGEEKEKNIHQTKREDKKEKPMIEIFYQTREPFSLPMNFTKMTVIEKCVRGRISLIWNGKKEISRV